MTKKRERYTVVDANGNVVRRVFATHYHQYIWNRTKLCGVSPKTAAILQGEIDDCGPLYVNAGPHHPMLIGVEIK